MAASPSLSASPSVSLAAGGASVDMAPLSLPSLIAALRAGTPAQMADILAALDHGMPLWAERKGVSPEAEAAAAPVKPVKAKSAGRPKKEPVPAAALPEAGEDGAPDAAAYRLDPSAVDHSVCLGREMNETDASKDKRWKPAVYRELQCGKSVAEGSDLCAGCAARLAKYAADPKPGKWTGRVTEEPLEWVHMLGTKWAVEKTPKWLGAAASAAASDASSDSGSAEEMPAAAPAPKGAIAASKKAEKAAEKEAAKAAKVAEKEAAKAAKEAEKAAAAVAAKAAKEAEKAAKKAEKEAKKAEKPAKAKKAAPALAGGAAAAAVPAKADTAAAVEAVEGELKLIDGSLYMVRNGNVYEYNDLEEKAGDFVGRLTADGEGIDADAEEVTAEESDSE